MKSENRNKVYIALLVIFILLIIEGLRIAIPALAELNISAGSWLLFIIFALTLVVLYLLIRKLSLKMSPAKEVKIKTKARTIKVKYKPGLLERFSNFCDKNFYK